MTTDVWTLLLESAARGTLLLLLAALLTLAMFRASAAHRHLLWTLAVIGVLLLPILSALLPAWQVALPETARIPTVVETLPVMASAPMTTPTTVSPAISSRAVPEVSSNRPTSPMASTDQPAASTTITPPVPEHRPAPFRLDWLAVAVMVWLLGAVLVLGRWLLGLWRVRRLIRAGQPVGEGWGSAVETAAADLHVRRPVVLRVSGDIAVPVVCGILRPTLLLPADAEAWPEPRRRAVLLHELAHIKRADCLTQLLARLACALHWWNPLAWLAAHRLCVERESACDDLVLAAEVKPSDYAAHLLDIAKAVNARPLPVAGIAMARSSRVGRRIKGVLDGKRNRGALTRWGVVLALAVLMPLVVGLAVAQSTPESPATETRPAFTSIRLPEGVPLVHIAVSENGHHLAISHRDKKGITRVMLDGNVYSEHPPEEIVVAERSLELLRVMPFPGVPLTFSPDGERLAYVLRIQPPTDMAGSVAVIDGKRSEIFDNISLPLFSPDSRHVAFAAQQGKTWRVWRDGTPGPIFDAIELTEEGVLDYASSMNKWGFSQNSRHFAYIGRRGINKYVVVDENEYGPYRSVTRFTFAGTGDGKLTFGYVARCADGTVGLVVDGHESRGITSNEKKGYTWIAGPVFSEDGSEISYAGEINKQHFLKHPGSRITTNGNWRIAGAPVLGLDQKHMRTHLAYIAGDKDGNLPHVYLDGIKVFAIPDQSSAYAINESLRFSPDGENLVFYHYGSKSLHIRGTTNADFVNVYHRYAFSPDGKLAYARYTENGMQLVVGNHAYPPFAGTLTGITFSPNGDVIYGAHNWVAGGTNTEKPHAEVFINGTQQGRYDALLPFPYDREPRFFFDAPDRFHYFAVKDGVIERVEVKLAVAKEPKVNQQAVSTEPTPSLIETSLDQSPWGKDYPRVFQMAVSGIGPRPPGRIERDGKRERVISGSAFRSSRRRDVPAVIETTGKWYDEIGDLFTDDEEAVLAYSARNGKSWYLVFGEHEWGPYDNRPCSVDNPQFSPDRKRIAYRVLSGGLRIPVIDGQPGVRYNGGYLDPLFSFSADSRRVAYQIPEKGTRRSRYVIDKEVQPAYARAFCFTFSPDGNHYAYIAQNDAGKLCVVHDGKEGRWYDAVGIGITPPKLDPPARYDLLFNADGTSLAYAAYDNGEGVVVLNGHEVKRYNHPIAELAIAAKSQQVAYRVAQDIIVTGNTKLDVPSGYRAWSLCLSPDGRHIAFVAEHAGMESVFIDGKPGRAYPKIQQVHRDYIFFHANNAFHYFIHEKENLYPAFVVEERLPRTVSSHATRHTLECVEEATGNVLFTSDDIVRFDWDRQVFELTEKTSKALEALPHRLQRNFTLQDREGVIYRGTFYSMKSSVGFDGPAIPIDWSLRAPMVPRPFYRIEAAYPVLKGEDRRYNRRLLNALKEAGVLGSIPRVDEKSPEAGTAYRGLSISLSCEKKAYKAGEPVRFTVRERNIGDKEILLPYNSFPRFYHLYVTDEQGKPVEKTPQALSDEDDLLPVRNELVNMIRLKPTTGCEKTYDLRQYVKALPPGNYTLQVARMRSGIILASERANTTGVGALSYPCRFTIEK